MCKIFLSYSPPSFKYKIVSINFFSSSNSFITSSKDTTSLHNIELPIIILISKFFDKSFNSFNILCLSESSIVLMSFSRMQLT